MNKQELLQKLNIPDAFKDFVPLPDTKLTGWNGDRPILGHWVEQLKPKLIIEIGSWMGLSATNFSKSCDALGLPETPVICVDTWLGSKEHWRDPNIFPQLELKNGFPSFYYRFLTNMFNYGTTNHVVPVPMPSQIAASYLKDFNLQAELIYVDGSHDEKDVYEDLMAFWDLLAPGGIYLGDDWPWSSVQQAIKAFSSEKGITYQTHEINWMISKPKL